MGICIEDRFRWDLIGQIAISKVLRSQKMQPVTLCVYDNQNGPWPSTNGRKIRKHASDKSSIYYMDVRRIGKEALSCDDPEHVMIMLRPVPAYDSLLNTLFRTIKKIPLTITFPQGILLKSLMNIKPPLSFMSLSNTIQDLWSEISVVCDMPSGECTGFVTENDLKLTVPLNLLENISPEKVAEVYSREYAIIRQKVQIPK